MNIKKIVKETEFIIQKKGGGWFGWLVYARHKKWSKWSRSIEQKNKPVLTQNFKEKIVKAALEEHANWKHNRPLWDGQTLTSAQMHRYVQDFGYIFLNNEAVSSVIIEALINNCEDLKVNEALQKLLDASERHGEYQKLKAKLKPTRIEI